MAESIWNNNYLLSNLDAQKLYAQSPLTTGVSGSSAYIGIEPSARYNETVLFDQSANQNCSTTAEFQMSESLWNFHRAIIEFDNMEYANTPLNMEIDMDVTNTATTYYTPFRNGIAFPALNLPYANFKINEAGNIKYVNRGLLWGNSWTSVNTTTGDNRGYRVRKVIGINHK